MIVYIIYSKYLYFPGGGKKDVTECCLKHGVDKSCIGECRLARPRQLPPNFCDQFKEVIAKCWAMGMRNFDNISSYDHHK